MNTATQRRHARNMAPSLSPRSTRKDPIAMTLLQLEQTELSEKDRTAIGEAEVIWKRLSAGSHLEDWLSLAPALEAGSRLAMRLAATNQPKGRGYNEHFSAWRQLHFPGMLAHTVRAITWFQESPARMAALNEIRQEMTPDERARMNSPITARQKVEKRLKPKAEELDGAEPELTATQKLKDAIRRLEEENLQLRRDAEGGSLFDLKLDPAKGIGRTIADSVGDWKAREIVKAIQERLKEKTRKPAG
jgi:hypothetical protein